MKDLVKRQPVVTVGLITTAIVALANATNAFGLTTISQEQVDALNNAVIAMWPLLAIIWALVTPAAAPALSEGTPVTLPDGTTGTVVRR